MAGVFALLAIGGVPATAQGVLFTGVVMSDSVGTPIADADVLLTDLAVRVRSNELGVFRISRVPPGVHSLVVRKVGFVPVEVSLTVPPDRDVERQIFLTRVTTLDSVRVVAPGPWRATFDAHRRRGIGAFLLRSDLDTDDARRLGDLLLSLKGVRIAGNAPHAYAISSSSHPTPGGTRGCYSQVYINGALTYGRPGDPLVDLNSFATDQIDAVEYYASDAQTPLEYAGMNSGCGVLLIWTRHTRAPS